MSCGNVKNPPGFALCRVAKSKTRRVSGYVVWQSPKPAGSQAMSSGKVQNPPGFAPCRVAKSKTRRVSRHVVWQSPKPAGFQAMSCGKVQNPPGFAPCRVAKSKTRRVSRHVECGNMKPVKFCTYPCRGVLHTPLNVLRRRFGCKTGRVLGVSLLERVKSGAFFGGTCFGRRGGSGVLTPINGDRRNASQIRPIFAASN